MSKELVFIVEPDAGRITVEVSEAPKCAIDGLEKDLGRGTIVNCGKPAIQARSEGRCEPTTQPEQTCDEKLSIWLYRLYHNSTVDGPGCRSVIQLSGCSIRCPGCYVPQTHDRENGALVPIASIVAEIVANRDQHDGVTILGGEPFDQPGAVAELVARLKLHGLHITIYSGYTLEELIQRKVPSIDYILTHIDLLIDGPFIKSMLKGASEYRGSRNQRLIDLSMATKLCG